MDTKKAANAADKAAPPISTKFEGVQPAAGATNSATTAPIPTNSEGSPPVLKKFVFTSDLKLLILHSIRQHDGHRAKKGKKDTVFENILDTFVQNVPHHVWRAHQKPVLKTVRDKFRNMLRDRKSVNSKN